MSAVDELLARHRAACRVAAGTEPSDAPAAPPSARPRLRMVIVTCMDVRIDPQALLGLEEGDAHVVRNAGGLVTDDAIRSVLLSQRLAGSGEVMLMQHTDCALHRLRDADLRGEVVAETGEEPPFAFGGFEDVEASVRAGMARLREAPWLEEATVVRGFVFDVATREIREVLDVEHSAPAG